MKVFDEVKIFIAKVNILAHLDYKKDFSIHFYANEHTMSIVLLQEDTSGSKVPISFMHVPLKNHELTYSMVEKQAFLVIKVVNTSSIILNSNSNIFFSNFSYKEYPH